MWADDLAKEIIRQRGKKLVVATGVTPSGPIHLGNLKEVMIGHLITEALKEKKADANLIFLVDNFDPLRKLYPFLPKKFEKYIGAPLSEIPDPEGCHKNYAEHFLKPFLESLKNLKVKPKIYYAKELYKAGIYAPLIKIALENTKKIAQVISKISGREMPPDWSPYRPLCSKCKTINRAKVTGFNLDKNLVFYKCECHYEGKSDFSKGEGKLVYRIQWPATWKIYNVSVEGFGKDHATKGGTYDTASEVVKKIFKGEAPYPIPYEWVYIRGEGKMAGSTGVGFTADEMLDIMPPEILTYFYQRSKPNKHVHFDPAEIGQLWNEYGGLSGIPFEHLAMTAQSFESLDLILDSLERSGYQPKTKNQKPKIKIEVEYIRKWLEKYAPEKYKFKIQKSLPKVKLSEKQKEFLSNINKLVENKKLDGKELHEKLHQIKTKMNINPQEAFSAIYLVFLGKDSGPQAGWFLAGLDREFVIKRITEVINARH